MRTFKRGWESDSTSKPITIPEQATVETLDGIDFYSWEETPDPYGTIVTAVRDGVALTQCVTLGGCLREIERMSK
jgi:hypothetical protein